VIQGGTSSAGGRRLELKEREAMGVGELNRPTSKTIIIWSHRLRGRKEDRIRKNPLQWNWAP
jgi:hypothetical protein